MVRDEDPCAQLPHGHASLLPPMQMTEAHDLQRMPIADSRRNHVMLRQAS